MPKLKTKKCKLKSCGVEFTPKKFWQKYHSPRCAWTVANKNRLALIRLGKKSREAHEGKGAA